jgi:hypothetical protein
MQQLGTQLVQLCNRLDQGGEPFAIALHLGRIHAAAAGILVAGLATGSPGHLIPGAGHGAVGKIDIARPVLVLIDLSIGTGTCQQHAQCHAKECLVLLQVTDHAEILVNSPDPIMSKNTQKGCFVGPMLNDRSTS